MPYIEEIPKPNIVNKSEIIFNEQKAYQMVSILKGAVDRGTGRKTKIDTSAIFRTIICKNQ